VNLFVTGYSGWVFSWLHQTSYISRSVYRTDWP